MEPTRGNYDIESVDGIDTLRERMESAESVRDWSFILADYISWGNTKISSSTGIFNFNAATDCPNAKSENCQVPWDDCYAHKAENIYPQTLPYRRRQEYLRDHLDVDTFAKAFLQIVERKRNEVTSLRLNEAGDFRHNWDVYWADRVAALLQAEGIKVYTYSASNYLDWDHVDHLTVNQSNDFEDYGDRLFTALPEGADLPDGMVWCPHSLEKQEKGVSGDEAIKCGDCQLCLDKEGPDVAVHLH